MKKIISGFIFLISLNSFSQKSLQEYNIILGEKFNLIASGKNERLKVNEEVIQIFSDALTKIESFEHPFDSIKQIGIIKSDDKKVKLYTWNIPHDDGTHSYYGFIQYRPKKKKLYTYQLKDNSLHIKNPSNQTLNTNNWFGALYYDIVSIKSKGEKYYTLLALDMNDWLTKKKIIDILHFDKQNQAIIGAPLFKNGQFTTNRIIFEYSAKASMLLRYDDRKEMIIFDHLAPERPSLVGKFEFYGSDFTYDGLKFEKEFWILKSDLDLKNSLY